MNHKLFTIDGSTIEWPSYNKSYFDQKVVYPELDLLTQHYDIIRDELYSIKEKIPDLWHNWIQQQLDVFPICFFGKWTNIAKEHLPTTCALLKQFEDNMVTASFSCLRPNCQIPPHMGWGELANNILRCHLGVSVPSCCGCVCDHFVVMHENEKWVVFDDSKIHSSFNFSDEYRFIMIIDMKRPSTIEKGTCKLAYSEDLLHFIESFYNEDELLDIRASIKK